MRNWFKRSGHATVVAYLALFLALGGGAVAIASSKLNGSTIKKRTLPGNRLKKHSITSAEVNLAKLGKVPTAGTADSIARVTPLKLTKTTSSATGATTAEASAAATPVTLYEDDHFKVYAKCLTLTGGPQLETVAYIATKQDGAIFDSDEDELSGNPPNGYLNLGTAENLREVNEDSASANAADMQYEGDTEFGATAADGYTIHGDLGIAEKFGSPPEGNGPYGAGDVCMAWITVEHT